MTRSGAATRQRILQCAYELFFRNGFARVGVDAIAARADVTKRTLYNHFESKDQLLAAALDRQHGLAMEQIQRWSSRLAGDVDGVVDGLFADVAAWASRPRWTGAGFTRLVMELADLPGHPARAIARRHKAAIEDWLTGVLAGEAVEDPTGKARQVMMILEGCMALMLVHGDERYARDAARAARCVIAGRA